MTDPAVDRTSPQRPNTALAFLLAPGIGAAVGGIGLAWVTACSGSVRAGDVLMALMVSPLFFALAGYPTAAIVGVPVFLLLPESARRCFALVVPLAGAIAAAPWIPLAAPWRRASADLPFLAVPFALGAVSGIAFLFLRRVPDPEDGGALPKS